jgi:hypothetical protein
MSELALSELLPTKSYYQPDYSKDKLDRIPDYRVQLYWNPHFSKSSSTETPTFYTSDVTGVFEIVLEGYTAKGDFITSTTTFTVE